MLHEKSNSAIWLPESKSHFLWKWQMGLLLPLNDLFLTQDQEKGLIDPVDSTLCNLQTIQLSAGIASPYVGWVQGANISTLLSH